MTQPGRTESRWRSSLGNVLVATDFSPGAERAVARAARLPITPGSTIAIVHVLPHKPEARAEAETKRVLSQHAATVRKLAAEAGLQGVDVFTHIAYGKPFVEIIRCARDTNAHLTVIGRHGTRAFRDLMIGSTAERVIRKGATPVLVVSSRATGPYRRPLIAVDDPETCRDVFELALRLAGATSDVALVHAYGLPYGQSKVPDHDLQEYGFETGKAARAMLDAFLSRYKAGDRVFNLVLRRGDARRVILDAATRSRADLLALGTHGRAGLAHALIGSVAEAVVRAAESDVLVARPSGFVFKLP